MEKLIVAIGGRAPVLHNLLRGDDEVRDAETLQQLGYSIALFPAPVLRAAGKAINATLQELSLAPRIAESEGQADWIGAADYLDRFTGSEDS